MQQNCNTAIPTLSILNDKPVVIDGPSLLHELVSPPSDALALDFMENASKKRTLSYQELHALSDAFAGQVDKVLSELEDAPAVVPVLLPQSPELYIALLAILKAGKAFCPLSLDNPPDRIDFILEDVSAQLLITNSEQIENKRFSTNIKTLVIDKTLTSCTEPCQQTRQQCSTGSLAYVLYTSGSTGLPKAVGVSHRAVTQSLLAHDRHVPHFTRFLQFAAPTFDVLVFEVFFPWFRGSTLVGCERAIMLDDLPNTIQALAADAAELTPTVVNSLLDGRSSVPGLKLLLTIGEMLTDSIVAEYGGSNTQNSILWGMYGPTEAAIHCTIQPSFSASSSTNNIGFPLDTVSAFVVGPTNENDNLSPLKILPLGEEGELALGGAQIADGYLNRPELTPASFRYHPEFGHLYKTGDRARIGRDGKLECLGRIASGQVKLHGQRVELGEIEHNILRIQGCRAVTAMIIGDSLVAFCVCDSSTVAKLDVTQVCKRWLPGYMVPSEVLLLSSMPQLPSGKVDKKALEERFKQTWGEQQESGIAPGDTCDQIVLSLFEEHLGRGLSLRTDLASTGLDSLRAIKLASVLRAKGYGFSATEILSAGTIQKLTVVGKTTKVPSSNGHEHQTPHPQCRSPRKLEGLEHQHQYINRTQACTPLQESMIAETLARPRAYCNWIEVELSGSYNFDDLRTAIRLLADINETLRSGFYTSFLGSSDFVQIVWKTLNVSQIRQVSSFSRTFSLGSPESLLRPFTVQVQSSSTRSHLLFQLHHALYDGWSFELILQDLRQILRGEAVKRRPEFINVVEYHDNLTLDEKQSDVQYWTSYLYGRVHISLPNYNGQAIGTTAARTLTGQSDVDLDILQCRSRNLMVSPQVFFQAATAFVISLYVNSTDVVIGNVTSGRTIPVTGIEDIVGPCIASLPYRVQFDKHGTVREILQKTHHSNRASLSHCSLPLREISRAANVPAGMRLFDILFVWQQALTFNTNSQPCARIVDSADNLDFKMTLEFEPCDHHISYRATYDPSVVAERQAQLLFQQIDDVVKYFLENLNNDIHQTVGCFSKESLSIANPQPRQKRPPSQYGPSHAVEKWANTAPQNAAIVLGSIVEGEMKIKEVVTYDELNRRSNQLARVLVDRGIAPDSLVGVIMDKSIELYVAILAVLKTGSGYLPIIPDLPIGRTKAILSDAGVAICISDSSAAESLHRNTNASIINVSSFDLSSYSEENLNTPYNSAHLAYAVFTSGSTGMPKGVLITQANLMSNLEYLASIYPRSSNSRFLQACSQAFDVSVFEIFFSWHVGMPLCTARKDDLFQDIEEAVNVLEVTHLSLTPTVAALIDPDKVPKVEFLVTSGEGVTEHVRRKWAGRGLWQGYGPSETTNICTVKPSFTSTDLINNIGRPFDNTSAFVLQSKGDIILPRGAVGELCFGGSQVFRGYLNRPELNAAKIIDHPVHGRIYRSGDMGILLPDNSILFTGRSDDQVKVRGQRVELGEINSALLDHDYVHDCATLLLENKNATEVLISIWVPCTGTGQTRNHADATKSRPVVIALYDALSHRLPSYMIPAHLIPITAIPVTSQGKIDKGSIQNVFDDLSEEDLHYSSNTHDTLAGAACIDEWEMRVAQVLTQCISNVNYGQVKRNSSFYTLGLDSISAIHFSKGLRMANLGDFAVPTILKHPTIERLASIRQTSSATTESEEAPNQLQDTFVPLEYSRLQTLLEEKGLRHSKIRPCTPLQEAMLSSTQSLGRSSYSNCMTFTVNGDVQRLQECWGIIVQRNEILRTSFVPTNDPSYAFAQVVLTDAKVDWGEFDPREKLLQRANETINRLLENMQPPVWLALSRSAQSTELIFCCHHALYDRIAINNILREVQEIYHGHQLQSPITYDIYLQQLIVQDIAESDQFWSAAFKNFEPTYFPNLTGTATRTMSISAAKSRRLQIPLSQAHATCRNAETSMLSLVQATWAKMLHYFTGESDICFGNVVSGRNVSGNNLDRLIAPCFNTLPVRVNFNFREKNLALLEEIHKLNVTYLDYQLTPLRRIQNLSLEEGGRLFDTLVILQQPAQPLDSEMWTLEADQGEMDVPLVCEIFQNEKTDTINLVLHYHSTVASEIEADIITEIFDFTLASIVTHPHAPANDTLGLPARLRAEENMDFKTLDGTAQFLHSGFERNVLATPDHTALEYLHEDGTKTIWSYRKLNNVANRISHELLRHGVKAEDIISIHITKSPLFYASILGVLKAGTAFSPVHPDLPESRKQLMLKDLGAKIMLCAGEPMDSNGQDGPVAIDVTSFNESMDVTNHGIGNPNGLHLAYCLFTSGSTGVPKAVSMEHRAPVHTIECSKSLIPWTTTSRILQYAAVTFDMCYYDCFLAWTLGFTLCAAEQQMMLNDLPRVINALDVDLLDLTPSVAVSLSRTQVPKVKWLYCIGEAMAPEIGKEWEGACVNSYGPTEAAFCTTISPISKDMKTAIIGKPFSSTSFSIFPPESERPLPILGIGELCIGGAQLAREYLSRPELTEDKFVIKSSQRFYRSGDIVRMLSDGNFEFIGRTDDQVKIRGLRVELGEIDHVLSESHPDVVCVVTQILAKEKDGKNQMVAFIVLRNSINEVEHDGIQRQLRQHATDRLPSYMVPQFFLFIDKLPRSAAAKIDKRALLHKYRSSKVANGPSDKSSELHPKHTWTQIETEVREIFARLARTSNEEVSPTISIYQLGLDSISAVQIAAALRREGHKVNASDVMRHTTCIELAAHIERSRDERLSMPTTFGFSTFDGQYRRRVLRACNIREETVEALRPCTALQTGMISQFLVKDGSVYFNHLRAKLNADIDLSKLKDAWNRNIKRHKMLRTGFFQTRQRDHPFIMIHYHKDKVELPWTGPKHPESLAKFNEWFEKIRDRFASELHRIPWQIRITEDESGMFLDLAIFHGLFDAQSLHTIFNDVTIAYNYQQLTSETAIDPTVDRILQQAEDKTGRGQAFWTQTKAQPCRFPNLSPLRYEPMPPESLKHRSERSLIDLENGCKLANTTLQAVCAASWLTLLSQYTGDRAVTCGVVLSGRTFEAATHAVFPCINTVPMAYTLTGDQKSTLREITDLSAQLQEFQHVPLTDIQRYMGHPEEALFDTIFAFQKTSNNGHEHNLWTIVEETASVEYPISIELEPTKGYLDYQLTFLPHVIPQKHATLLLKQLDHILQLFLAPEEGHSKCEASLYAVTPAQESSLPSEVDLLHELVEKTAKKHPQRIALEFADSLRHSKYHSRSWSYCDLNIKGNQVAHLLIHNGARPGDIVGVCFDKCPEASFAMLGILKAGCAFVAIDPGAPACRQAFIVKDSKAVVVLSMAKQAASFEESIEVAVLNLDKVSLDLHSSTKPRLERQIDAQDRSYCLYTSGTTGSPKGCELTHENAVQALLSFKRLFSGHWYDSSRWLQFASYHFDVSILEQFWSWSVGICVVSAPRDLIFEDLAHSIRTLEITHIDLTPSLAQLLHPDDVPSLCKGVFITGGESLKQEILDTWGQKAVIYNGYGPTEATIGCTMYPRVPANGKPSNIGWQFDNVGTLVLVPETDLPVLRGGVGELCVVGKLVGKGYLNRDDLTARSFPYLARFEERVYRTGDLVRILHDRSFEFLGRADDQIKLRGQRLEIGEINSVIRRSSHLVKDVATLVLKHNQQHKEQLVTFVVAGDSKKGKPQLIYDKPKAVRGARDACHERLPSYMVPTHFIPLTSIPLNVNNKADARMLKEIYTSLSMSDLKNLCGTSEEHNETWSNEENGLKNVIKVELGPAEDTVTKDVSFFELGMDSISVISFVRALKQAGFNGASASLVMSHSTIRRLIKALSHIDATDKYRSSLHAAQQTLVAIEHSYHREVAQSLGINSSQLEALAPCTPLQQGMIARFLHSDSGLYFNTFMFELSDNVDYTRLRSSWENVHASYQILRTVFVYSDHGHLQAVVRDKKLLWKVNAPIKNESQDVFLARSKEQWVEKNRRAISEPFEIIHLTMGSKQLLLVHIFHGLYDGISIDLIFETVWDIYNARESSPDVLTFQQALAHGPLRQSVQAKAFWQEHLTLPHTRPLISNKPLSLQPIKVMRHFNAPASLESTRRKLGVTVQAIAQGCWVSILQRFLKGTIILGIVVSGRNIDLPSADRVAGPMFNTIPYQFHHESNDTWEAIIKRVHEFNVAAHPYQHTSLRDIFKWCRPEHNTPLFDNLFVYQIGELEKEWKKNNVWEVIDSDTAADYPLAIEVQQSQLKHWDVTLVAQKTAIDERQLHDLLDGFEQALHEAVSDPTSTVGFDDSTMASLQNSTKFQQPLSDCCNDRNGVDHVPWTDNANKIRDVLVELTGVSAKDMSMSTSIFELGLDSIDAIKLSSRLKKVGVNLAVSGIMQGLTIEKMLPNMFRTQDNQQAEDDSHAHFEHQKKLLWDYFKQRKVDINGFEDVLPPTPLQEAMVADMLASDFTRYYNFDVLVIDQHTDIRKLRAAWTEVVVASPILRTCFYEVEDPRLYPSFAQIVMRRPHEFWSQMGTETNPDFPMIFETMRKRAAEKWPFTPPFQVLLVEATANAYIVLCIAHALYDGSSLGLLHTDVERAYRSNFTPRPDYRHTLPHILSASGSDSAKFWQDSLEHAVPSRLPRSLSLPSEASATVDRQQLTSTLSMTKLAYFAKKANISFQTVGQAVFAIVLSSYTRSLDITFGAVVSGRDDETTSELLFPTMNTVAVRTILHGTRLDFLRYTQDSFTKIKQWQHFPLRKALALTSSRTGLFDGLFIYQKVSQNGSGNERQLYTSIQGHSNVEYPLCVEMEFAGGELLWRCAVKKDILEQVDAKEILSRMDKVLHDIVQNPDNAVIDFTSHGITVCNLPSFANSDGNAIAPNAVPYLHESHRQVQASTQTIDSIRKALSAVSGTAEEEISDDMTIFHVGLDSISAIKVSSLLRQQNIVLSVGEMLRAGSLLNIACRADARSAPNTEVVSSSTSALSELLSDVDRAQIWRQVYPDDDDTPETDKIRMIPVTAGQLYMLSMWLNSKGSNFYAKFEYDLLGSVSFAALGQAWGLLLEENQVLRSRFVATHSKQVPYVQIVRTDKEERFELRDATDLSKEEKAKLSEEQSQTQPWVHLEVSRMTGGWRLELRIHHSLYDGVSLPLLIQQLQNFCNGAAPNSTNDVLDAYIAKSYDPAHIQQRKSFWQTYWNGLKHRRLKQPTDLSNRTKIYKPGLLNAKRLTFTARRCGLAVQHLVLAAYARVYAKMLRVSQQQDVAIGLYLANRSLPIEDIDNAAVPLLNLLPLRVSSPLGKSLIDVALQVKDDIRKISEETNILASLHEINEWTGVTIDTFVNFLALPDKASEEISQDDKSLIKIVQVGHCEGGGASVTNLEDKISHTVDAKVAGRLRHDNVNKSYLHAVDIEATIRNGALDLGIFGPTQMLSLEEGMELMEHFRMELDTVEE